MKSGNAIERWNKSVVNSPAYRRMVDGEDECFWERHADVYVRNRSCGEHKKRVEKWLLDKVRDASIIEIGPGPGIFTRFLSKHCSLVTAVEPSPANASYLVREMSDCGNVTIRQEKWEDVITFPHDVIFSSGTVHVFTDIETVINKMLCHAEDKVLLVAMNDGELEIDIADAIGVSIPEPSAVSVDLFLEVLWTLNLSFDYQYFSERQEYVYPDMYVFRDVLSRRSALYTEHWEDIESLFRRRGLLCEDGPKVRMMRDFNTYMVDISALPER